MSNPTKARRRNHAPDPPPCFLYYRRNVRILLQVSPRLCWLICSPPRNYPRTVGDGKAGSQRIADQWEWIVGFSFYQVASGEVAVIFNRWLTIGNGGVFLHIWERWRVAGVSPTTNTSDPPPYKLSFFSLLFNHSINNNHQVWAVRLEPQLRILMLRLVMRWLLPPRVPLVCLISLMMTT